LLGWQNSATYGSVISYNIYWLVVIVAFLAMRFNETRGHWPLMKPKQSAYLDTEAESVHGIREIPDKHIDAGLPQA
jgi:high-affinity iron transporter